GDGLRVPGVVGGGGRTVSPVAGTVNCNQNGRNRTVVEIPECADNGVSGVLFISPGNPGILEFLRDRNGTMERISVCGTETRNRAARLRPSGRVFRMGVAYAADTWERFVEDQMRRQIGGGPQLAFHNFPV